MTTPTHINAPRASCKTCAHVTDAITAYPRCARLGFHYCEIAIDTCKGNFWQPKPPRRSLRRWLWDTLFA